MRKTVFLSLFLLLGLCALGQEPRNNLGKTISQMSQKFPGMVYDGYSEGRSVYKYGEEMAFYFKDGRCVEESMTVKGYGSYPKDWFNAMVNAFLETNYLDYSISKETALFMYSSFHIFIMYQNGYDWEERWASIMYCYPPEEN